MIKKIILSLSLITATVIASENIATKAQPNIDYNQLMDRVNNAQSNDAIKAFMETQSPDPLENFYKNLQSNTKLLDKDNVLGKYLEEQKAYDSSLNAGGLKSFTIFYFISEDTSPELIRSFAYDMQKIKEIDPTVDSLLITRGLIGGNFDTMADYVKKLQKSGITKLEVTFHPWAFEHFKLEKVPAYALSYCEKDFRFKTCENKFLVRGEVSLTNFFEIVSDEDINYKKYYKKLIEAK